jgi:RNA polymerase sigma-70 factor (ECF subfamily)
MPTSSTTGALERSIDTSWIRAAVERYEGPLVLYASKLTGDVERARDVVQEVFLRLCSQRREEVESHLAEWLYTVCRNRALDVCRKEQRMSPLSEKQAVERAGTDPGPDETLERQEAASHMIRALNGLPDNQQEVLRLKFQHGLTYREISRVTKLTVGNVGFLIHAGLRTIRQRMTGTGGP